MTPDERGAESAAAAQRRGRQRGDARARVRGPVVRRGAFEAQSKEEKSAPEGVFVRRCREYLVDLGKADVVLPAKASCKK